MKVKEIILRETMFPPLFHGTSSDQLVKTGKFNTQDVYLTDDETQAPYYAHGLHLGGSAGDTKYILTINAHARKMLDADDIVQQVIMDEHEQFRDIDELTQQARKQGYHYITFEHPSFDKEEYHNVVVSLHPNQDLEIVGVDTI